MIRENEERKKARRSERIRLRYVLIVAVIMILMAGTVMAAEPLREKIFEMIEQVFCDHTEISFQEIQEELQEVEYASGEFTVHKPEYIPEGYELFYEEYAEEFHEYVCGFENEEGYAVYYEQCYPQEYDASITSDGTPAEIVYIGGHKAYWITDSRRNTILYVKDGYLFSVSGRMEYDKLADWMEKNLEIIEKN